MGMRSFIGIATAMALTGASASAEAPRAPRVSIRSLDQLRQPLPLPYDESADAGAQVAAAKARAKASGKRLLIDLGGDWCADCRILAGIFALPEVDAFLKRHYEVVTVDVGRFNKNGQIPLHYGVSKLAGVPALLVIDPRTDKLLNKDQLFALADARSMTPQSLADWLAKWI
jgi:thiol-disulfide isomerase/thioredoxin